ncbi:COesterase domain containing protein [Asbolus verrucosus]|uniref:COesterase domain containing protein n=1 Tax=Asbolus verrucosus TaxID=1661398 RepID=A0A482VA74_ASBVE|nr:COesterase domain containing protein [Asbolus verrucosus]
MKLFDDVAEHTSNMQGKFFGPVIEPKGEEAFLTEKMYELVRDGKYIKVPLMIGFTSEECIEYYKDANGTKRAMEDYDTHLGWLVPADMEITDEANLTRMGRLIRDIYTNGESFSKHLGDGIRFCSDNLLKRPIMKHAEFNSKYAKTYLYVFSYDGKVGNINVELDGADSVGHGEEIKYLLCSGSNCDLSNYTKSDQITQERLIKLWTNFAKYGNPTPEPSKLLQNVNWPQISTNNGNFLHVDIGENMEIRNHPLKTYSKWNELYDSLGYDDFVTY